MSATATETRHEPRRADLLLPPTGEADPVDPDGDGLPGVGTPEPPEPLPAPEPAAEPEAGPEEPVEPTGRLKALVSTAGWYVVLWARAPSRGDHARPRYAEVGFYQAGSPSSAKRAAMAADENQWLRNSTAQKPGILLRAVPAVSWPVKVEATAYEAGPPKLVVR